MSQVDLQDLQDDSPPESQLHNNIEPAGSQHGFMATCCCSTWPLLNSGSMGSMLLLPCSCAAGAAQDGLPTPALTRAASAAELRPLGLSVCPAAAACSRYGLAIPCWAARACKQVAACQQGYRDCKYVHQQHLGNEPMPKHSNFWMNIARWCRKLVNPPACWGSSRSGWHSQRPRQQRLAASSPQHW